MLPQALCHYRYKTVLGSNLNLISVETEGWSCEGIDLQPHSLVEY
jgi:hypothetical protein